MLNLSFASLRQLSVRRRLTLLFDLSTATILLIAFFGFLLTVMFFSKQNFTEQALSLATVTGASSRAAFVFSDRESGARILSALKENKNVMYAVLLKPNGLPLAEIGKAGFRPDLKNEDAHWSAEALSVRAPVVLDGEVVGTIVVVCSLSGFYSQLLLLLLVGLLIVLVAAIVAVCFSHLLQRWVSTPIATLHGMTQEITRTSDLSTRIPTVGGDEIQELAKSFNTMLARLEKRETQLSAATKRAEEAVRLKSMFLATVSHELRTPLHAIIGMTEEVLDMGIGAEHAELLEVVRTSGKSLLYVVNDILDYTAIESGSVRLSPEVCSVEQIFQHLSKLFQLSAERKGLQLNFDISPNVPDTITVDSNRLGQVLVNLIANAVKFTPAGFVNVLAECRQFDAEMNVATLRFSVTDTGIGIPEESLSAIFESFRTIRSENDRIEGTGLGLAISAKLIGIMDGKIWAESASGKGSTFFLEVPCETSGKKPRASAASPLPLPLSRQSRTILVVEDNAANQKLAQRILERVGYRVLLAGNGEECLTVVENQHVDLILMDLNMPVMNGYQATRRIRDRERATVRRIPIVAFTASVSPDTIHNVYDCGVDAYLPKPIDRATLLATIDQCLIDDSNPEGPLH